jgi:hypothetical protein
MFRVVARYLVTFDMPLRLAPGERAMAIAGRLHDRLQSVRVRGVAGPEVATYKIRRGRLRAATVSMTVQASDPAKAVTIAMDVLRESISTDARSWDVAAAPPSYQLSSYYPAPPPRSSSVSEGRALTVPVPCTPINSAQQLTGRR